MTLPVVVSRSEEVVAKIGLHLDRFRVYFIEAYGHDRVSTVLTAAISKPQLAASRTGPDRPVSSNDVDSRDMRGGRLTQRNYPAEAQTAVRD